MIRTPLNLVPLESFKIERGPPTRPYYVIEYLDGVLIRPIPPASKLDEANRQAQAARRRGRGRSRAAARRRAVREKRSE